eukprot:scaffold342433_cov21-Prasinocladus_malaysianus.AAC.1
MSGTVKHQLYISTRRARVYGIHNAQVPMAPIEAKRKTHHRDREYVGILEAKETTRNIVKNRS